MTARRAAEICRGPCCPKLWRLSLSRGFPQLAAFVTASFWLRLASEVAKRYDVHVLAGKGWIAEPVAGGRLSTPGPLLYYPDTACCLLRLRRETI